MHIYVNFCCRYRLLESYTVDYSFLLQIFKTQYIYLWIEKIFVESFISEFFCANFRDSFEFSGSRFIVLELLGSVCEPPPSVHHILCWTTDSDFGVTCEEVKLKSSHLNSMKPPPAAYKHQLLLLQEKPRPCLQKRVFFFRVFTWSSLKSVKVTQDIKLNPLDTEFHDLVLITQ